MNKFEYEIRPARVTDIDHIAYVHSESWKETYSGIMPDEVFNTINLKNRINMWETIFHSEKLRQDILVVTVDKKVVGFAQVGKPRDKKSICDGELHAIYLLKKFHGNGIGGDLLDHTFNILKEKDIKSMYLWVLKDNSTSRFYEKMGGTRTDGDIINMCGKDLVRDIFIWKAI